MATALLRKILLKAAAPSIDAAFGQTYPIGVDGYRRNRAPFCAHLREAARHRHHQARLGRVPERTVLLSALLRPTAQGGELASGHFLMPAEAPWLSELRRELRAFPDGKHDDQVDALSQFVLWQRNNWQQLLEERMPDGRIRRRNRLDERPW